ncbi:MAG: PASTA domain-containing protein, partial [Caldilineae bacterium]
MAGQTLKKIALTALLVLFPAVGWTGALDRGPMQQRYNPAAESMIRVPGVVGLDEQQALSILQQAGLTVRVRYETFEKNGLAGKEFTVIDQEPGTAGVAMLGSTVTITVYTPPGAVQPGHYGQGGYGDNGGYGGYQQQPDGYYDDGSGGYQQQPGGYGDGGNQQQGGYDEYGNPLPAEQAPVPWGGGGQPAGGSRLPAESLPAEAPAQPAA